MTTLRVGNTHSPLTRTAPLGIKIVSHRLTAPKQSKDMIEQIELTEEEWRHCRKCQGLAYDSSNACSGGGTHINAYSSYYTALVRYNEEDGGRRNLRLCTKCKCMFNTGVYGEFPCAKGGNHMWPPCWDYSKFSGPST